MTDESSGSTAPGWLRAEDVSVDDLAAICEAGTDRNDYPHASTVARGVLIYDMPSLNVDDPTSRLSVEEEMGRALRDGPGVIVLTGGFSDPGVVDAATQAFERIIEQEREAGGESGDHFGKPGANARIWNAQEKLARSAPDVFAAYFATDAIALGAHAWLGPAYQMTSQVNLVYPGGAAQLPHRDYHLGFQSDEVASTYPAHVHAMSTMLTLQGAVAHGDMPVDSGTTMLLPHSQKYPLGYVAYRRPDVQEYFERSMIQLPLTKGDIVYFNPALLHGAGTNRTSDVNRMANLLQVSSAFGRAMESLDREAMCASVYPALLSGAWTPGETENIIASCAEGYPFPTNLDRDQPVGGLAPASQADVMRDALAARIPTSEVVQLLSERREAARP